MPAKATKNKHFLQRHFLKIFALAFLFAVVSLFRGDYSLLEYFRIKDSIEDVEIASDSLQHQKTILEAEKERLESDEKYIEKIAREKYKMTKKGEKITRIVRSTGSEE